MIQRVKSWIAEKVRYYWTLLRLGKAKEELQDTLFKLREERMHLQGENHDLREQVREYDKWEETLARYELVDTPGKATVYKFKGEPEHYACPSCLAAKREIHILQDRQVASGVFDCPGCEKLFRIKPERY